MKNELRPFEHQDQAAFIHLDPAGFF
jgi:hypothetical protein